MPTIANLQVHEPGHITLEVTGTSPLEVKLENWNRWRPIEAFSWYPPHLVVGSQTDPLNPGDRTISIRDATGDIAQAAFTVPGEVEPPPPQPPFGLPLVFEPKRASDWSNLLDDFPVGGLTVDAEGEHRAWVGGGQQVKSAHMEFHELDWPGGGLPVPSEGYYEWDSLIAPPSVIEGRGTSQFHGDNQSGFTGSVGIVVLNGLPYYRLRIMDAGNPTPRPFGVLRPGEYQRIGIHVRWAKDDTGFARCYLDGKFGCEYLGRTAADRAGKQMFRIGWYTSERIGPEGLDLRADNVRVYGRAG